MRIRTPPGHDIQTVFPSCWIKTAWVRPRGRRSGCLVFVGCLVQGLGNRYPVQNVRPSNPQGRRTRTDAVRGLRRHDPSAGPSGDGWRGGVCLVWQDRSSSALDDRPTCIWTHIPRNASSKPAKRVRLPPAPATASYRAHAQIGRGPAGYPGEKPGQAQIPGGDAEKGRVCLGLISCKS
jgi:hypothetical protein